MSGRKPQNPNLSSRGKAGREARQDRLAEALRDNLRRRKAQARGRAGSASAGPEDSGTASGRSAGGGESGGEA